MLVVKFIMTGGAWYVAAGTQQAYHPGYLWARGARPRSLPSQGLYFFQAFIFKPGFAETQAFLAQLLLPFQVFTQDIEHAGQGTGRDVMGVHQQE
ncbi:MAG: hypothetical protein WBJ03_10235 [Moraxellaceae bacterium]